MTSGYIRLSWLYICREVFSWNVHLHVGRSECLGQKRVWWIYEMVSCSCHVPGVILQLHNSPGQTVCAAPQSYCLRCQCGPHDDIMWELLTSPRVCLSMAWVTAVTVCVPHHEVKVIAITDSLFWADLVQFCLFVFFHMEGQEWVRRNSWHKKPLVTK